MSEPVRGSSSASTAVRWCVIGRHVDSSFVAVDLGVAGTEIGSHEIPRNELAQFIAARETAAMGGPRWVWADTAVIYPPILAAGVRVERCQDLRLCHQILASSSRVHDRSALLEVAEWRVQVDPPSEPPEAPTAALFDFDEFAAGQGTGPQNSGPQGRVGLGPGRRPTHVPDTIGETLAEFARQRHALASTDEPARLGLLLAAESAGALIAAELAAAGVPWDAEEHDRILAHTLGPRPAPGARPAKMLAAADATRHALGDPSANLDSHVKLLRSLRAAGIEAASTSQWELSEFDHPAIAPLLEYKKLSRLLSANGWAWLDEWVRDGRYRPVYIPGGVVTGRWASSGGGALQLPKQLRPALRADPGWLLVSADVSQLEPRVLAAMSGDLAMARAGTGTDLYAGIVATGAVATRQEAKLAVLGAMYGSTTGDSGRLVPRLRRAFPDAMRLVDDAAAVGERGGIVSTWLGRSSPGPSDEWQAAQAAASMPNASSRDEQFARRVARERGRFTRNFVVQGTAAEWALAWMAELRLRLARFDALPAGPQAASSGPVFAQQPHLAFFLHDEIIVHTPREYAGEVAQAVEEAARVAGHRLFGGSPVDFRLDLSVTERASKD